ncbi:MAG: class I SAM-dependent methyltransferase [Anaerolineales bacterium]|nr:class I SAM-dependent methyltransferase [Anaerolineales bacterium]
MRIRKIATQLANAVLRPLGGEVVRAGLVGARADEINALRAELAARQAALELETDRAADDAVQTALALAPERLPTLRPETTPLAAAIEAAPRPEPRAIFTLNGQLLPCWQDSDVGLYDDWLLHPRNYPVYFALFQQLSAGRASLRLLEIGVRTGYLGATFAQAVSVPGYYVGVDPNQYMANGLDFAAATFRRLREARPGFDYALWEGFSWRRSTQKSLEHCGPYDLVHIDGDHSLTGKLVDLDLARRVLMPGGLVLVDDFDHHPPVAEAIRRAMALGWYRRCTYLATMRGLALLEP